MLIGNPEGEKHYERPENDAQSRSATKRCLRLREDLDGGDVARGAGFRERATRGSSMMSKGGVSIMKAVHAKGRRAARKSLVP